MIFKQRNVLQPLFLFTLVLALLFPLFSTTVFAVEEQKQQLVVKEGNIFEGQGYMPSIGTANVPVLVIDFPDEKMGDEQARSVIEDAFFSEEGFYGGPSLASYYFTSSYEQLNITGDVHGVYTTENDKAYYEKKEHVLVDEIMSFFSSRVDFSKYDANEDGTIDSVYIVFAGSASENKQSTFWPHMSLSSSNQKWGGKELNTYCFLSFKKLNEKTPTATATLIHETGHLLGLPDLYDTTPERGLKGGSGPNLMMSGNVGDHDALSKLMLGWVQPKVVTEDSNEQITLRPLATHPEVILVPKKDWDGNLLSEFFLIEYFSSVENNSTISSPPGGGLRIWHADLTLKEGADSVNSWSFAYNNSDGKHKMLKLIQADNRDDIEKGEATEAYDTDIDLFLPGDVFANDTNPNSDFYTVASHLSIYDIQLNEEDTLSFDLSVQKDTTGPNIALDYNDMLVFADHENTLSYRIDTNFSIADESLITITDVQTEEQVAFHATKKDNLLALTLDSSKQRKILSVHFEEGALQDPSKNNSSAYEHLYFFPHYVAEEPTVLKDIEHSSQYDFSKGILINNQFVFPRYYNDALHIYTMSEKGSLLELQSVKGDFDDVVLLPAHNGGIFALAYADSNDNHNVTASLIRFESDGTQRYKIDALNLNGATLHNILWEHDGHIYLLAEHAVKKEDLPADYPQKLVSLSVLEIDDKTGAQKGETALGIEAIEKSVISVKDTTSKGLLLCYENKNQDLVLRNLFGKAEYHDEEQLLSLLPEDYNKIGHRVESMLSTENGYCIVFKKPEGRESMHLTFLYLDEKLSLLFTDTATINVPYYTAPQILSLPGGGMLLALQDIDEDRFVVQGYNEFFAITSHLEDKGTLLKAIPSSDGSLHLLLQTEKGISFFSYKDLHGDDNTAYALSRDINAVFHISHKTDKETILRLQHRYQALSRAEKAEVYNYNLLKEAVDELPFTFRKYLPYVFLGVGTLIIIALVITFARRRKAR